MTVTALLVFVGLLSLSKMQQIRAAAVEDVARNAASASDAAQLS